MSIELVSSEQEIQSSNVYVGYLILQELKGCERLSILDLHQLLKEKNPNFTYSGTLYALIFLFINNIIDFDEPYIYKISI